MPLTVADINELRGRDRQELLAVAEEFGLSKLLRESLPTNDALRLAILTARVEREEAKS
jgi:hypothetical protein